MELSFFHNVTDIYPQKREMNDHVLQSFCKTVQEAPSKDKRTLLFSPNIYHENSTRKKENVQYMTGIVFDIDHKNPSQEIIKNTISQLPPIIVHAYTTWSHTSDIPRWRLIIPFQEKIEIIHWENIFERTYKLFNHPAVDMSSKNPAAIYFAPYIKDKNCIFYAESWIENRKYLTPKDLPSLPKKPSKKTTTYPVLKEESKIIDALNSINADLPYDDWIKIGMALHHEWGDMAFPIWDRWSLRGAKYPRSGDTSTMTHWKSFKDSSTPITIATLYKIAKEYGFDPKQESYFLDSPKNDFINFNKEQTKEIDNEETEEIEEEELVDQKYFSFEPFRKGDIFSPPSGLVKTLFEWFEERSLYKSSSYSLSAAIALTGFILRNHVRTATFLRTNFLILTLGYSGSGKTHTLKGIIELLRFLKLDKLYVSRLGSYQGALEALHKNEGQLFLIQDEASYEMKSHLSKSVANHEMRIQEFKMKTFSCQPLTMDAIKGTEITTINDSFFCEFSTATDGILRYFSQGDITNGLLPRYFLIKSNEKYAEENIDPKFDLTPKLQEQLREYINYNRTTQIARLTFEAEQYFLTFKNCINEYIRKSREQDLQYDAVFARLAEHAQKLALITAIKKFTKNNDYYYEIELSGLEWAISVVVASARNLLKVMDESFSENIIEEYHKRVFNIIKEINRKNKIKNGWITRSQIYQKCRFINSQTLESLLLRYEVENLIELRPGLRGRKGLVVRIKQKGEKNAA